jgi:N-glycosylase/DNA lyase
MILRGPIDLPATLRGGQAFRWRADGDAFVGDIGGRAVRLTPRADGSVDAVGAPRAEVASYFRLEPADAARRARLARDPVLAPALAAHPGLRLLRQDPWETTVAFVTSANNHVLRIEGILRGIAAKWGARLDERVHAFPPPERVAAARESTLRALGLGYRAPFVRETARRVARGDVDLRALRGAPLGEAREALLDLPGVGPKVADCIALFSLDADGAFPIDRWVERAMREAFGELDDVAAFARERWGDDAGLAQQVLFHAIRARGRQFEELLDGEGNVISSFIPEA